MQALFRAEEPNHPRRIIRFFEWKIIRCPETGPSKQASLKNCARSLIERRAEPLGNLNKGLPSAPRVAYPLMRHVHASHHIKSHHITSQPLGGLAPPLVKTWGASPYFIPFPPPRGDTDSGVPHGQRTRDRGASPSFRTPPGIGRGWRPSAVQARGASP